MGPPALPQKCEINEFFSQFACCQLTVWQIQARPLILRSESDTGGIVSKRSSVFAASPREKPCMKPWLAASTHCITLVR